jgi:hypothetical protein
MYLMYQQGKMSQQGGDDEYRIKCLVFGWIRETAAVRDVREKQLLQPSNAGNGLGFACDERNIYKGEER